MDGWTVLKTGSEGTLYGHGDRDAIRKPKPPESTKSPKSTKPMKPPPINPTPVDPKTMFDYPPGGGSVAPIMAQGNVGSSCNKPIYGTAEETAKPEPEPKPDVAPPSWSWCNIL
jgi:hypothetical protein